MIITTSPVAIPVSTANPPTESVASEAAKKIPVPKATPSAENPTSRNGTENQEQPKNTLDLQRDIPQTGQNKEGDDAGNSSEKQNAERNSQQESKQEAEQNQADQLKKEQLQQARQIEQLKSADREVRAHEAAHASAGGQLAGAPQLSFTTGPDGKRYAVAGEVSIDTSKVSGDPQSTINKMNQVRQAALAPANPSSQDLKVAAMASQLANQAQVELNVERNQASADERTKQSAEADSSDKGIEFSNPVSAKRSSLQLNQKIIDSGALDDFEQTPRFSQSA